MAKFKHWTKEEHALLAHLISMYLEDDDNLLNACEFASKKLGRSKAACYAQYHNKMRNKPLSDFALEEGTIEYTSGDYDIDKEERPENTIPGLIDFLNSVTESLEFKEVKEPEITVYSGFKQDCKIIVQTDTMIVAEFGGSIITIKL
jgi:hypothetical protein